MVSSLSLSSPSNSKITIFIDFLYFQCFFFFFLYNSNYLERREKKYERTDIFVCVWCIKLHEYLLKQREFTKNINDNTRHNDNDDDFT